MRRARLTKQRKSRVARLVQVAFPTIVRQVLSFQPVTGETLFEEMKRYVRFTDEDAAVLAAFGRHAAPSFDAIADEFYDRIREHEEAHKIFTGEEQVERLKRSLVRWMDRLCAGPKDEAHFEETSKIGRVHVRIGLPQRYMFTAIALIQTAFDKIADSTMGAEAPAARSAIGRIFDLELAIMLEAYQEDQIARLAKNEALNEERLAQARALNEPWYAQAVELARVLIIGLDSRGIVRLFNKEAERVTGLGREEIIGAGFVDVLLPEALREEHGRAVMAVARGQVKAADLKSAVRTRAGKVREMRWQLVHAPSDAAEDVVLFAIGQDTTEESALAARARQSEKLAAVGTLAAGLAHEIRNPLNGAYLHMTFLERGLKRRGIADEETLEAVKIVGEEIKRLGALVSEFLDFARPMPLMKKRVSVKALCERAVELTAPEAAEARVRVKLDLPTSDLELEIDGAKMEQVLLNLLRNAVEAATAAGGGNVTMRVRRKPREAVIEVEDDGPGLPSPDAPIFDPFFSTKPQGTGLGLAIVHRVVTDHEGTIDVVSRPKKTVFRVTLPIQLT